MWDVGLAKMFKERDVEDKIGPCVGKIVGFGPLKISILGGEVVLNETIHEIYITRSLLDKEYRINLSGGNISGSVSPSGELISLNITDGNMKLNFELKVNDEVLLIPGENQQVYFIVDIVEKVGG